MVGDDASNGMVETDVDHVNTMLILFEPVTKLCSLETQEIFVAHFLTN